MRKNSAILFLAILLSGCASTQSERVYVDLERAVAQAHDAGATEVVLPNPKTGSPPVVVKQSGLPATSAGDRTLERLEAAKKLIADNRGKSIAALSSMLKRVYMSQAEDEITKRSRDVEPEQNTILQAALDRLRVVFEAYGFERGPMLARLNTLARSKDLATQPIPDNADGIRTRNITEANKVRDLIRKLDARYDAEATQLLDAAEKEIQSEIVTLRDQAKKTRQAAEAKAVSEAETKATATQTSLDVQVKQLLPENLPAIPARQVTVPGSAPMSGPPTDKSKPIFGSLEERRSLLDQEIEIWIRSTGKKRSLTSKGVRDMTEEFLQWRSAHKVGP